MAKIIQLQRAAQADAQPTPVIVDDAWTVLRGTEGQAPTDEQIAAAAGSQDPVLFPFGVWQTHKDGVLANRAPAITGIWLAPEDEPGEVKTEFGRVSVLAVDFPVFRDGRGFSTAYLLRTRYGWTGQLRAIGDVLRDQLFYMQRVGFDAFAVREDKDIHDALNGLSDFSEAYQASWDRKSPLFRRAQRGAPA